LPERKRSGSAVDQEKLEKVLTGLWFKVQSEKDLKAGEIMSVVKSFSQFEEHKDASMENSTLLRVPDGKLIRTEEVVNMFNDNSCSSLQRKPKLFIFQACSGNKEMPDGAAVPGLPDMYILYSSIPEFVSYINAKKCKFVPCVFQMCLA
jgi:hypothetical protein